MADEPRPAGAEPDPGRAATAEDLGRELTLARERAGLSIRQVARAAGIPVSTAGDYFAGRHLPLATQADTLRELLRACGYSGPGEVAPWVEAMGRVRRSPGRRPARAPVPYRGLSQFEPEDAEWFFGRDELIGLLLTVTASGPLGVPVTVTGASGSGKSSLLRAGLAPRLRVAADDGPGGWTPVIFTPGGSPMETLTKLYGDTGDRALAGPDGDRPGSGRVLMVVDQLEEVFTACSDETERAQFIAALSARSRDSLVVLGLRADFYGHALRYPVLAGSLQQRQVVVGPMTRDQLRETIVEPARKARLTLDPGLADLMLGDLAPGAGPDGTAHPAPEAGTLPLLSHALRATYDRCRGGQLTVAGYQAAGGIWDAVARTADAAYDALGDHERDQARLLFLRLIHVSDDAPLTRARVPLAELPGRWTGDETADGVLDRFVTERLVTIDDQGAQLTHEALLSAWPRLRDWIAADQDSLKVRHRITAAAAGWQEAGRDTAVLLRGAPLAVATEWADQPANRGGLGQLARDFLDAAQAHEAASAAARRRQLVRLRGLAAALAALVLLAGGLTVYAFGQRHAAAAARDQADSREVAVEAQQIRGTDPSLAAQLSLAAYQISPTQGALGSLLESAAYPDAARFRDSTGVVQAVALAPGGRTLGVAGADGTFRLWNVARAGHPVPIGSPLLRLRNSPLYAAAFSPDGRLIATAGAGGTIHLWHVDSAGHATQAGPPLSGPANTVYSVAFSPGGRILAAGSADDTVRLWDISDPSHPVPLGPPLTGPASYVQAIAFSPGGSLLAAGSADGTIRLWSLASPARPAPVGQPLTSPGGVVDALAFSPDGRTLAAGSRNHSVGLWDLTNPEHPVAGRAPLTDATDWVNAVAFSPDGTLLAAASSDDRVLLWDAATGALVAAMPDPQPVTSLAWDGNRTVIAGADDGMVRMWQVPPPVTLDGGSVNQVAFGPGGKLLAVAGSDLRVYDAKTRALVASAPVPGAGANSLAWSPGGGGLAAANLDGTMAIWRLAGGRLTLAGGPLPASGQGFTEFTAFAPGGQVVATGADDGTVRLWSVADPARPRQLASIPDSGTYVYSVAFSPDGRILAAVSADNLTRLWDVSDPARPRPIGKPLAGPASYAISVAFSPDGRVLAVGSADKSVRLWDVTDRRRPRPLAGPLTGPGGFVYSVAFSPDGSTLAAGSTDGTMWLWDVADPAASSLIAHVTSAMNPTGRIYTVAFNPAGTVLATGSSDGSVRLWDTRAGQAAAAVCAAAGQPLTPAEWASYIPGRPYNPPCR